MCNNTLVGTTHILIRNQLVATELYSNTILMTQSNMAASFKQQLELAQKERAKITEHADKLRRTIDEMEMELLEEADACVGKIQERLLRVGASGHQGASLLQMSMTFTPEDSLKVGSLEVKHDSGDQSNNLESVSQSSDGQFTTDNIRSYLLWRKPNVSRYLSSIVYIDDSYMALLDRRDKSVSVMDMNGNIIKTSKVDMFEGCPLGSVGELAYHPNLKALALSLPEQDSVHILDASTLELMHSVSLDCSPDLLAVQSNGSLVLGDSSMLNVCTAKGNMKWLAEYYDDEITAIRNLVAVAVDGFDNIYLCDKVLRKIFKMSPTGSELSDWNIEGWPLNLTVYKGLVFVAEQSCTSSCFVNVYSDEGKSMSRLIDWPKLTDGYNTITSLAVHNDQLTVTGKEGIKAFKLATFV